MGIIKIFKRVLSPVKWRKRGKGKMRRDSVEKNVDDEQVIPVKSQSLSNNYNHLNSHSDSKDVYGSYENLSCMQSTVEKSIEYLSEDSYGKQIVPSVHKDCSETSFNNISSLKEAVIQQEEDKGTKVDISVNLSVKDEGLLKNFDGWTVEIRRGVLSHCECKRQSSANEDNEESKIPRTSCNDLDSRCQEELDSGSSSKQFEYPIVLSTYSNSSTDEAHMETITKLRNEQSVSSEIKSASKQHDCPNNLSPYSVSSTDKAMETIRSYKTEVRNEHSISLQSSSTGTLCSLNLPHSVGTTGNYLDIHESRKPLLCNHSLTWNEESSRGNLIGLRTERQKSKLTETAKETSELMEMYTSISSEYRRCNTNQVTDSNLTNSERNRSCQTKSEICQTEMNKSCETMAEISHTESITHEKIISNEYDGDLGSTATDEDMKEESDSWSLIDDSSDDDDDDDDDRGGGGGNGDDEDEKEEEDLKSAQSNVLLEQSVPGNGTYSHLHSLRKAYNLPSSSKQVIFMTCGEQHTSELSWVIKVITMNFRAQLLLPLEVKEHNVEVLHDDCLFNLKTFFVAELDIVCYTGARKVMIMTKLVKYSRGSYVPMIISVIEIDCDFTKNFNEAKQFIEYKDVSHKCHEEKNQKAISLSPRSKIFWEHGMNDKITSILDCCTMYYMDFCGLLCLSLQQIKRFARRDHIAKTKSSFKGQPSSRSLSLTMLPITDTNLCLNNFVDLHLHDNRAVVWNNDGVLHTMQMGRHSVSMKASGMSADEHKSCSSKNGNLNVCPVNLKSVIPHGDVCFISEMETPGLKINDKNQSFSSVEKSFRTEKSSKRASSTIKHADRQYFECNSQISKVSKKHILEVRIQQCNSASPIPSPLQSSSVQSLLSPEYRSISEGSQPLTLCIKLQHKTGKKPLIRKEISSKDEIRIRMNLERSLQKKRRLNFMPISNIKLKLKHVPLENLLDRIQNSSLNPKKTKSLEFLRRSLRISSSYRIISAYPITQPRTGLDGFFQRILQGEEMNYRQKMQYEWLRIQSFWSFPINSGMSMIYLARNGFYYTGRSTECRCFLCGHTYSDWETSDNNSERIIEIHTRISPNCVFLTGGNHNNVPIHQESPISFAFGQVPPSSESRTTTEGSVSSSSSRATSSFEAIDRSDQRQTSTSEAHPHIVPSPLLTIPETIDSSGQARSVSPVSGTAQSSTTTESSNQQGAPSVTASSSSELLPTSQPTTSQSGATFLVEPSPTISLPPPSGSSHTGPSEQAPLQSKSSPERDSSSSQGQNIHEKLQSSGAPTSVSSTSSQATAIVPHSVLRASGQSSGQTASGETTVTRSQSSAGGHTSDNAQSKDDRRETYDVQVVDVVTGLSNASSTTRKVVYRVTLHLSEFQYSEELNDTNHQEFLRICGQLTPIFEHLFHNVQGDQRINIIRFIPNPPVLVVFDLESYNFSDEAILRSIFSRAIQRGAISKYRISPAGFEFGLIEESNLPGEGASGLEQPAASSTTRKAATSASGQQHATETGRPRTGTSTTAPPRPQRFDPLGINFDRPRYPAYAVLTVRSATYTDWPTALTQEPLQMAVAGFFYAGYGDYVRCFFCGGGLRNWDDGDDPWEEHAKWFPRCAFVRQNKGEKFVNDVQRRHHEQGAGIEFEDEVEEQVPDEELPAFRSLLEMNYSPETIRRAIEAFRQRIRPGRQIGLPMSATNLADIIFEFEEGNNDNSIGENRQDRGEQAEAARTETGTSTEAARTETGTSTEAARTGTGTSTEAARTGTGTSTEAARTETGTSTEAARTETATTPDNVVESGRMSEEERRAEQTKLLDDPSAGDISEESEDDLERMKEENISWKEKLKCKICLEKDVAVAFLPCGHLVCCTDCAPAIRICIICNDIVKGTVKTFFP